MKALASPALQRRNRDYDGQHGGLKIRGKINEWDEKRKRR